MRGKRRADDAGWPARSVLRTGAGIARLVGVVALLGVAIGLAGCQAGAENAASDGGASGAAAESGAAERASRPPDTDLTPIGPGGQTRIYYQFIDEHQQVRFVERLADVPEAWRDKVGFVELSGPPPLTPADARRASRADPTVVARGSGTPSIVLYSADWCGYCRQAKKHLNDRGVAYSLRDVDVPAASAELFALTGSKGIPVLDLDGRILQGYSSGSYDEFLSAAGL